MMEVYSFFGGEMFQVANYGIGGQYTKHWDAAGEGGPIHQGVSCDRLCVTRTHAPRTSRLRCARTHVRIPNLKWSHFASTPALLVEYHFSAIFQSFFCQFFKLFFAIFQNVYGLGCSKTE